MLYGIAILRILHISDTSCSEIYLRIKEAFSPVKCACASLYHSKNGFLYLFKFTNVWLFHVIGKSIQAEKKPAPNSAYLKIKKLWKVIDSRNTVNFFFSWNRVPIEFFRSSVNHSSSYSVSYDTKYWWGLSADWMRPMYHSTLALALLENVQMIGVPFKRFENQKNF